MLETLKSNHVNELLLNIKISFLPPNKTSYLQPLDQQIIKSLKIRYRKYLSTILACRGEDTFDALNSITLLPLW